MKKAFACDVSAIVCRTCTFISTLTVRRCAFNFGVYLPLPYCGRLEQFWLSFFFLFGSLFSRHIETMASKHMLSTFERLLCTHALMFYQCFVCLSCAMCEWKRLRARATFRIYVCVTVYAPKYSSNCATNAFILFVIRGDSCVSPHSHKSAALFHRQYGFYCFVDWNFLRNLNQQMCTRHSVLSLSMRIETEWGPPCTPSTQRYTLLSYTESTVKHTLSAQIRAHDVVCSAHIGTCYGSP